MIDTARIKQTLKKSEKLAEIYGCRLNLGFSGGKDSVVLRYFAEYYGIDYIAHFNNTQIEQYKGMIRFIKENYPDVHIIHPDKENSFFELMKKNGLPSMFYRWCCKSLKHSSPKLKEYHVNIMGVRGEESEKRAERGAVFVFGDSKRAKRTLEKLKATFASTDSQVRCEGGKDKINIYPIFDLTEREIFNIIKTEKLVIPDAYSSKGRLGCAFCPFASFRENLETIKNNPNLTKMWLKTLSDGDFLKTQKKFIFENTNEAGLFYLYIKKYLTDRDLHMKGLRYLNEKDLYGKTGLQLFEDYLKENVWKSESNI
jgi:3'-phosphoadenosine 5'-phosphosulfate sulfotransferase (PAPS reductase)/FAD synthetase